MAGPVQVWAMLLFRITGLVFIAPIFSALVIPMRAKAALTVLLAFLLLPAGMSVADGIVFTPGTILTEVLVGLVVGLGAALFVGAAEVAGDMLAVQMGLSGASIVDPTSRNQVPVVGQVLSLMSLMLILVAGGHAVMIQALAASMQWVPPGSVMNLQAGLGNTIQIGTTLFLLGLKFAAPVIGALMIGHVALGVLARTAPQMNVLMMAFPLQIGVGLLVMGVTLPNVALSFHDWPFAYGELVGQLLERMAQDGGGP